MREFRSHFWNVNSLIVKLKNRIDKKQTLNKNETLRTW